MAGHLGKSFEQRFWEKVNMNGPIPTHRPSLGRCWVWTAGIKDNGYGRIDNFNAHRISYIIHSGTIPAGKVVDHLCRVRVCVNPAHLEAKTQRENLRAPGSQVGMAVARRNQAKTHCKHGHEFTPENTRQYKGERVCRTCQRLAQRAAKQRSK